MRRLRKYIKLIVLLIIVVSLGSLGLYVHNDKREEKLYTYEIKSVVEGNLVASSLLSGNVVPSEEQYVKFEASRGIEAWPVVNIGDRVEIGQQLVQYNVDEHTIDYDIAVRKLHQVGREIEYLKTYGPFEPPENYNKELQRLYDDYANAQSEIDRNQIKLDRAVVKSKISGIVAGVEAVNYSSDANTFIAHVVNEEKLRIEGVLTQFDLINLQIGQEVKIKSKASPNSEVLGKIDYIAPFPKHEESAENNQKISYYDFRVELQEDVEQLRPGFHVTLEAIRSTKSIIVPITAIINKNGESFVWLYDPDTQKIAKTIVKTGVADGENQEVLKGLSIGHKIIINPDDELEEDEVITNLNSE
ncbi:TPA: efflux RND transporter periplasmic adaptor subunit [Streptococcus suis]|uniref:efflux RND transporter periplasmic adaptor subunit n=1 Tax=Streptococcus suis TaxID=1307 RepID=UPI0003F851C3|nr:efflux RND transporter periplasmic adaptor subunit [Streptococcus suis]MCO8202979.1 efflux RND transporter periplasmic adaptor subunit [Streptococcus suis]HEM3502782.1 efflux RND transporter periplasmic adaptor subunit [Streptococcus suis]